MARIQLALNVFDLSEAVKFHRKLFDIEQAKLRPGYANFIVSEPPLKLVLIGTQMARAHDIEGALNHLGVEVENGSEVVAWNERLQDAGLDPTLEEQTTCCYAVQDKARVHDPEGAPYGVYAVLADIPPSIESVAGSDCCMFEGAGNETSSAVQGISVGVPVTRGG